MKQMKRCSVIIALLYIDFGKRVYMNLKKLLRLFDINLITLLLFSYTFSKISDCANRILAFDLESK